MSLPKFLYFIVEADGRSRQVVNGIVTSMTTPKQLPNAPIGNQEVSIGWERSPIYYGNIRNFSLPLGFVTDGRKILQNDFYKFNIDRQLFLLIKRLTTEWNGTISYKEYYKQWYKGELDFSTAEDNQGEHKFEINIMEGGLQKQFKAAENTKYDIPFDIDAKNVLMDGMFIKGDYRWFIPAYEALDDGYPGLSQLPNDNPIPGLALFDVMQLASGGDPTADSVTYFAEAAQDVDDVVLTGRIVNLNSLGSSGPLSVRLIIFNTVDGSVRDTIDLTPDDPYPENYTLEINETIDLLRGDRLFLKSNSYFAGESSLQLSAKSKPATSYIKGFTLADAWRKVIARATGSEDNFESDFLDAENIILTSGDGVRGIAGAGIKLSIKELWEATNVYTSAGLQITDKIRIDSRATFYDESVITDLGEVKNFKCTPAIDLMGTSLKVGHAEQQVDDTNGKFDFNGFIIYSTPIQRIAAKEIDLQSSYKASPHEIEQTRANYEGKTTTDKETDNNVFALAVAPFESGVDSFETTASFFEDGDPLAPGEYLITIPTGNPTILPGMKISIAGSASNDQDLTVKDSEGWFFGQLITVNEPLVNESDVPVTITILEGQIFQLDRSINITQLTDPDVSTEIKESVFNVPLSPARLLQRHYPWLAGVFYNYEPGYLKFESNNRNKELIAGGITEKANVLISAMGDPLFLPFYFEFDTTVPTNIVEVLENNPNTAFSFTWNNNSYTGFFIKGGFAASTLEEQTFKLLAAPSNDLLNLIQ